MYYNNIMWAYCTISCHVICILWGQPAGTVQLGSPQLRNSIFNCFRLRATYDIPGIRWWHNAVEIRHVTVHVCHSDSDYLRAQFLL